ncbi:hypothetical protein FHR81_003316 [Actinoalloteichus hoggarensis]|uniref:Uncharacterized protein n=1 Tax=Actinoalloteichus hoggarensis TaxID=1470176 RepID=A0A221W6S3_9PSEU|nr:hypothetical protein [Actinoalloteichus hoggarensis]ASO21670.1 hypothetical protein AHOG_20265 [Actinoalloteichus hoggarensis]MBB5922264.1 hypothetical protein [Actinoalloteichus hoggarensis]
MYGPRAAEYDDVLLRRFVTRSGHSRELLLLYRAAYAVLGANSYAADGTDGHFAWCAAVLARPDVRELLC